MSQPVIVLGSGGHAKVLIETLLASSTMIAGIADPAPSTVGQLVLGVPVIGNDDIVREFPPEEIRLVNGIGSVGLPVRRQELFERFKALGYRFATIVHPSAVVASDVELSEGAQIMAGAVIQPGSRIGSNVIVNTRASVDHDCIIGDHVHIAPGATLSGDIVVGDSCHIGTGATVIQGIRIGPGSVIGAGTLVLKNVPPFVTVVGVPAKVVKQ